MKKKRIREQLGEAYSSVGGYFDEHEGKEKAKKAAKSIYLGAGLFYADMSGYKNKKHRKARSLTEMF